MNSIFKQIIKNIIFCLMLFPLTGCATHMDHEPKVKRFVNTMAVKHHFNRKKLLSLFHRTHKNNAILAKIQTPYEDKPWYTYRELFVTDDRTQNGVHFWRQHKRALSLAEKHYGVPASIIVAIIGVETKYGKNQGNYPILNSLSTLAFYYPPRGDFFKKELEHYLLLCREAHWDPARPHGSYAGAMGQPQFMPSSYRHYAVASTRKKYSDLVRNPNDAILSVANYLKQKGWKANEPIATPATDAALVSYPATNKLEAQYSLAYLKNFGISPLNGSVNHQQVGLIELQEKDKKNLWLGFNNFYVITRYNTSVNYAMAVLDLSKKIKDNYLHTRSAQ